MKLKTAILAIAFFIVFATGADAAITSALQLISGDSSQISKLEDIDYEALLYDSNGDGLVTAGDVLVGMYEVTTVWKDGSDSNTKFTPSPQAGDATFTAVFAAEVVSSTPNGTNFDYDFTTPNDVNWAGLVAIFGLPTRSDSGVNVFIYDDANPDSNSWVETYDIDTANAATNITNAAASLATAMDGTLLWEFGFTKGGNEFWNGSTGTQDISEISDLNLLYDAGLSLIANYTSLTLLEHNFLTFDDDYDLEITGSDVGTIDSGWLVTNTDLYINTVPEPASILTWACLAGIGAAFAARRRRES